MDTQWVSCENENEKSNNFQIIMRVQK